MGFDVTALFRSGLPPAEAPWVGFPPYSFVGGHNDAESVPFGGLVEAAMRSISREGPALASYNLGGNPQGYEPLRRFVAGAVGARAGIVAQPDQVLITSGSLQALDLVNAVLLEPGDTVVVEQATYGGMLSRLQRIGVRVEGAELDENGIQPDRLAGQLDRLAAEGRTPKYVYTIPTVQNPTGSVMPIERRRELLELARRHGLVIFEDDCYADLTWDGTRPPAIRALDEEARGGQVIYCGSFSKSIAPALRVGYLLADWPVLAQMLAMKTDAGSGALEQLVVAEYAAAHFDDHLVQLRQVLRNKCDAMRGAVREQFGAEVEVTDPQGGIFLWLTFPEGFDTGRLVAPAAAAGVEFNAGAGWSADPAWGARRMRLCFGHPSIDTIRAGVAVLAGVVRQQA